MSKRLGIFLFKNTYLIGFSPKPRNPFICINASLWSFKSVKRTNPYTLWSFSRNILAVFNDSNLVENVFLKSSSVISVGNSDTHMEYSLSVNWVPLCFALAWFNWNLTGWKYYKKIDIFHMKWQEKLFCGVFLWAKLNEWKKNHYFKSKTQNKCIFLMRWRSMYDTYFP